ncbi:MAG: rhodanese-like domain-containing protein [Rubrobacteraceae bacterium]
MAFSATTSRSPGNHPNHAISRTQQRLKLAIHCKTGGRNAKAVKLLQDAGFANVYNVKGGITAWSEEIDPSVPKY